MNRKIPILMVLGMLLTFSTTWANIYTDYVGAGHWDAATMALTGSDNWTPNYNLLYAANGAGLDVTGLLHSYAGGTKIWLSRTKTAHSAFSGTRAWIQFDLGENYSIGSAWIWNANSLGTTTRGFKDTEIFTSTDGVNWTSVWTGVFNQSIGTDNYVHETEVDFSSTLNARYIMISATTNWGDVNYPGALAEVRFNIVPEPATMCLLAVGAVLFGFKRRVK